MSSSPDLLRACVLAAALCAGLGAQAQGKPGGYPAAYPGIGRDATPKEVAAWDIDVRPDFKGLPPGSGSVQRGQDVWEAKCASCHGVFGESNEVFSPLVGGTTPEDIQTGRVARLRDTGFPGRTTLMKVPTVSTLWDYIHRAMPWNQPKSLNTEEVYAVTAYLLNLGGIVPDDFTLSDRNIGEVQARMPNRNGVTIQHALWPGPEFGKGLKPDTAAKACMRDCPVEPKVASRLPDFARNNHGNLADQNRPVGAQRGVQTADPAEAPAKPAADAGPAVPIALLDKNACTACHAVNGKLVGPSFADIGRKYHGKADYIAGRIRAGSSGVWGNVPMPPQALGDDEVQSIARWLAAMAKP
jgi:cytochrome c